MDEIQKEAARRIKNIQTPTGSLAVVRPLAEKLLKEGVISGEIDGVLHAADAATVKAAVMAGGVCDFCSAPGIEDTFDVPDFDMPLGVGRSTDGWAACGPCAELIRAGKRDALLKRSVAGLSFPKFSKFAIEDLHRRFWAGMDGREQARLAGNAIVSFIENKLPIWAKPVSSDRDKRIEAISRVSGLTPEEIDGLVTHHAFDGVAARKLVDLQKKLGKVDAQRLADLLNPVKPPVPKSLVPHWQQALDEKFEVAASLRRFIKAVDHEEYFPEGFTAEQMQSPEGQKKLQQMAKQAEARREIKTLGYELDLKMLPGAQTYSFNAETEAAILEASKSFPRDVPLSGIETPNSGSGWFWFGEPLPIPGSPMASDYTHALLWAWTQSEAVHHVEFSDELIEMLPPDLRLLMQNVSGNASRELTMAVAKALRERGVTQEEFDAKTTVTREPGHAQIVFSVYVRDEKQAGSLTFGKLLPSTRWFWSLEDTFEEMLEANKAAHRRTYGPGTPLEHDPYLVGETQTLQVVADLSLFFAMSCLWFRQTVETNKPPVLTKEKGHIERHAKKRYIREHKLTEEPIVQVVALRKSARVASSDAPVERQAGAREYHCRWIVQGHPRKQPYGPGRKQVKVIWIEAHPAGPEDKPLRTKNKVFAVVR